MINLGEKKGRFKWLSLTKIFGILTGLLLIVVIVLSILYGIERNKKQLTVTDDEYCLNPSCIKAANYLLESIDETVDPCEDFFEFACGAWIKKTRIPDSANSISSGSQLSTQLNNIIDELLMGTSPSGVVQLNSTLNAHRMYASCLNEEAIEVENVNVILPFINIELGGWPILQGLGWNDSTFDLSRLLLKLTEYSNSVIFNVGTQIDQQNSSIRSIRISQNNLALGNRNNYYNETDITRAYRQFMRNLASALTNDTTMIENDVNDTYAFEQRIARYVLLSSEQSAQSDNMIRTAINNLSSAINASFDFVEYLHALYRLGNVTLNDNDIIVVSEIEYIRNISLIMKETSPRILQNYLVWRFIMIQAANMPRRFQLIKQQFDQVYQGANTLPSRAVYCGGYVNNIMGFAVAKLYKDKYFDTNARKQSLEMIDNIRDEFIDLVEQSTWMDADSKAKAIEKAKAIDEKIGYPDFLDGDNMTQLENEYAENIFSSSYMQNQLDMLRLGTKRSLQSLRRSIDRTAWIYPPVIVNAFYNPSLNDICFPAGILQPPFFAKDFPKYLNYGGIGMVMGHEITHGFDDNGRLYDKNGNKLSWWTADTIEEFNKRKECIIQQYNNYTMTQVNLQLNGEQTQGENIADNGGLKEAFFAYQKWAQAHPNVDKKLPGLSKYTAEQLFFLNFGQQWCAKIRNQTLTNQIKSGVHSPSRYRVIGPTSNFPEFARVFNCRLGQNNNPENKCTLW